MSEEWAVAETRAWTAVGRREGKTCKTRAEKEEFAFWQSWRCQVGSSLERGKIMTVRGRETQGRERGVASVPNATHLLDVVMRKHLMILAGPDLEERLMRKRAVSTAPIMGFV